MKKKRRPSDRTLDNCPIHTSVITECIADLKAKQAFHKENILTRLHLIGVKDAVYWDYIRRKIENGGLLSDDDVGKKIELFAVSNVFFKFRRPKGMTINSVLAGPGGKAAGYALATCEGGIIALASTQLRTNQKDGLDLYNKLTAAHAAAALIESHPQAAQLVRQAAGLSIEDQSED